MGGSVKRIAVFFLVFIGVCTGARAQIAWEVVNRFPLLSASAFDRISKLVGTDPVGMEMRLTQVEFRSAVRHLDGSSAWNERAGRYDVERLLSEQAEIVARTGFEHGQCNWTLTKSDGQVALSYASSCDKSAVMPVTLGATYELLAVRVGDSAKAAATVKTQRYLIVALGDSFASGEGNPDYPAMFKQSYSRQPPHDWAVDQDYPVSALRVVSAQWLGTDCHRSLLSWPALYALRTALSRADTVVQFASFACSGAEVIDGFLLPQRNPPGRIGTALGGEDWFAKESQQEQLARLLCGGQDLSQRNLPLDDDLRPYLEKYGNLNAKATTFRCENPRRPNEVLVQFGGNDTAFSGVVKYVFQPQPVRYRGGPLGWIVGSGVNFGIYKILAPVRPAVAAAYAERLPQLYAFLKIGLHELGIEAENVPVRMVIYPDPIASSAIHEDQAEELKACNRRTRDANRPMQSLIASRLGFLKHDGALAGANAQRLIETREQYITALRGLQRKAAESAGWQLIDSQAAIDGHGLCAGSLECERLGDACPNGDRVRWAFWKPESEYVFSPKSLPWRQVSHFSPYDLERKRGLRYANDALLTSARLTDDGARVRLDWTAGIAHPTAAIHARIAGLIPRWPAPKSPSEQTSTK